MVETATTASPKAKAERKVVIRLDRTRPYSTVHGDRTQEDPMHGVFFFQNDLPFDANGNLMPIPEEMEKVFKGPDVDGKETTYHPLWTQARRDKLKTKQKRVKKAQDEADQEILNQEELEAPADPTEDVNLESWLLGEAQYPFYMLARATQQRFHVKVHTMRALVECLVMDEKIVLEPDVDPRLMRLLDQRADPRLAAGYRPRAEQA